MDLNLVKVNQILTDLRNNKLLEKVEENYIDRPIRDNNDGRQGEENTFYRIFKVKNEDNLFVKIEYYTDSYGDGESIQGIEFVKPKEKVVTVYEQIKN